MITPPDLRTRHVTVRVENQALLEDVTLTLPPGSMTALLGPNGAGKTTLIRVLAGLLPVSDGEVELGAACLANWDVRRSPGSARTCPSRRPHASRCGSKMWSPWAGIPISTRGGACRTTITTGSHGPSSGSA